MDNFGRAAANGLMLLEHLYSRPLITVTDIRDFLNLSFATANNLNNRFIDTEILSEITGHARNRIFRYDRYVDLFRSI